MKSEVRLSGSFSASSSSSPASSDFNAPTMNVHKQTVMERISDLEFEPKDTLKELPSHRFLAPTERMEGQWEHLQYYEEQKWQQGQRQPQVDSSYSSLASSATSSSTSEQASSSKNGRMSTKAKLLHLKREGWRKIKNRFSSISTTKSTGIQGSSNAAGAPLPRGSSKCHSVSYHDFQTVSAAPDGSEVSQVPSGSAGTLGVIPKIRYSKSMQNLEAITRDSYYNIRDATNNLKQRYHSKVELRQAKPKTDYQEFWDEDSDMDEEEIRRQTLEMVGLC